MTKTKIEWCDLTWNPIWGCKNACQYCYARKIAKRFGRSLAQINHVNPDDLENFKPVFLCSNFMRKFPKKRSAIFINSMSEPYYWNKEWLALVLTRVEQNINHQFFMLTKHPKLYYFTYLPLSLWIGFTAEDQKNFLQRLQQFTTYKHNSKFISFEPLLGEIKLTRDIDRRIDWIIVGAQTGIKRTIPKKAWIESLISQCQKYKIPLFVKNNIYDIYPELPIIQQFPEYHIIGIRQNESLYIR